MAEKSVSKKTSVEIERTIHLAICPPAVRTVVVEACRPIGKEDSIEYSVHPVVAIQTRTIRQFNKTFMSNKAKKMGSMGLLDDPGGTELDLLKAGWRFVLEIQKTDPIILSPDFGLTTLRHFNEQYDCATAIVVCPWPQNEDEKRLKEFRDSLRCRIVGYPEKAK